MDIFFICFVTRYALLRVAKKKSFQTLAKICVFPDFLLKSIYICLMISNFDRKMMIFRRYSLKSVYDLYDDLDVLLGFFAPGLLYLHYDFEKTSISRKKRQNSWTFFWNHRLNIGGLEQKIRAKHPNRRTNHIRIWASYAEKSSFFDQNFHFQMFCPPFSRVDSNEDFENTMSCTLCAPVQPLPSSFFVWDALKTNPTGNVKPYVIDKYQWFGFFHMGRPQDWPYRNGERYSIAFA